jgi:hypothetical protein
MYEDCDVTTKRSLRESKLFWRIVLGSWKEGPKRLTYRRDHLGRFRRVRR